MEGYTLCMCYAAVVLRVPSLATTRRYLVPLGDVNITPDACDVALFYLADNGVTVICPDANVGDTGEVNGVTYTKRNRSDLDILVSN